MQKKPTNMFYVTKNLNKQMKQSQTKNFFKKKFLNHTKKQKAKIKTQI